MIHLNCQLSLIFDNYTVATSFDKLFKSLIWAKFCNCHHNLASLNQFWQPTHGVINSLEKQLRATWQ